jgi:hypothetical protein
MARRITEFLPTNTPVTTAITKFGGQPTWLGEPTWPISVGWNIPMRFICQVEVDGGLAYVFVTHPEPGGEDFFFDPDVIEPDGGENAVIIQPNGHYDGPTSPSPTGPTLYLEDGSPAEFTVTLTERPEPDFLSHDEYMALPEDEQHRYYDAVSGSKLGGAPAFFQGDAWSPDSPWRLLLQLEADDLPCYLNLGASPLVFVATDDGRGQLVIQDS